MKAERDDVLHDLRGVRAERDVLTGARDILMAERDTQNNELAVQREEIHELKEKLAGFTSMKPRVDREASPDLLPAQLGKLHSELQQEKAKTFKLAGDMAALQTRYDGLDLEQQAVADLVEDVKSCAIAGLACIRQRAGPDVEDETMRVRLEVEGLHYVLTMDESGQEVVERSGPFDAHGKLLDSGADAVDYAYTRTEELPGAKGVYELVHTVKRSHEDVLVFLDSFQRGLVRPERRNEESGKFPISSARVPSEIVYTTILSEQSGMTSVEEDYGPPRGLIFRPDCDEEEELAESMEA